MQYLIIIVRQVIFSDASTFGFDYSFMTAYFRGNFNALKSFDAENLDKMLNSALVQIQVK